jgi:hypothetical protein
MSTQPLNVEMFSDKLDHEFVVEEDDVPAIRLRLREAKATRNVSNAPRAPFSLLFTSEGDLVLPQRMYALRHPVLGLHVIFLVPIAKAGGEVTYEAIFN